MLLTVIGYIWCRVLSIPMYNRLSKQ